MISSILMILDLYLDKIYRWCGWFMITSIRVHLLRVVNTIRIMFNFIIIIIMLNLINMILLIQ